MPPAAVRAQRLESCTASSTVVDQIERSSLSLSAGAASHRGCLGEIGPGQNSNKRNTHSLIHSCFSNVDHVNITVSGPAKM